MSDELSNETGRSALQVFLGFLLGILIAIGCNVFAIFVGLLLRVKSDWFFFLFIAVSLVISAAIALHTLGKSSFATGVLISLSIAFLLDGTCAIAYR
jgi:uncharacterized membrane protein